MWFFKSIRCHSAYDEGVGTLISTKHLISTKQKRARYQERVRDQKSAQGDKSEGSPYINPTVTPQSAYDEINSGACLAISARVNQQILSIVRLLNGEIRFGWVR